MTDKAREEFEASPRFKGMDFTRSVTHPEYYESPYANGAWDGWQASRAALVIEIPEGFETYCGSTEERVVYADEMKDVLLAAGLKVAP